MLDQLVRRDDGTRATGVIFEIGLDVLEDDPYPIYEWMRRELPIAFVPEVGRVLITTWDLCTEAGTNDEVFGPTQHPFSEVYGLPNVMSLTGQAHRTLRNSLNPPFRPRAVNDYREAMLRATAIRYVDAIRGAGGADVSTELLEPISVRAIGDVMGFTDVDDETIGRWFRGYAAYLVDFGRDEQVAARGRAVKEEVRAYLERRLPELAASPAGDALSHMLHDGMPEGRTRSVEELIGTVGLMIVGGIQEPAHAAANALVGLLGRPDQAARVAAEPAAWSAAGDRGGAALAAAVRHDREADHHGGHTRRSVVPGRHRGLDGHRVCEPRPRALPRAGRLRHRPRHPRTHGVRVRRAFLHRALRRRARSRR